jgi:hypothetical protein
MFTSEECNVKKERERLLATNQTGVVSSSSSIASSRKIQHITKEVFEDALDSDSRDTQIRDSTDDTNKDVLLYIAHVTNHYLCLVEASNTGYDQFHHSMKYPIISDCGANFHMFKEKIFFDHYSCKWLSLLGDGKISLSIQGMSTVKCSIGGHPLVIENVHYTPDLSESIYNLFLHIQNPGHVLKNV